MGKPLRCRLGMHAYVEEHPADERSHGPDRKRSADSAESARVARSFLPAVSEAQEADGISWHPRLRPWSLPSKLIVLRPLTLRHAALVRVPVRTRLVEERVATAWGPLTSVETLESLPVVPPPLITAIVHTSTVSGAISHRY